MKREIKPPEWPLKWLEFFCDSSLIEGISGDLEELFFENLETRGHQNARFRYWLQSIGFTRLIFSKRNQKITSMKSIWFNYLLTAFRSLRKNKLYFGINLLGLVVAITCALYALIFIADEFSYDGHISGKQDIYRLYKRHINIPEKVDVLTYETSGMMGPTMVEEYPDIVQFCRVLPWWDPMIFSHENTHISNDHVYFADSSFLEMFDVKIVRGASEQLLKTPSSILLSERLAQALFANEDPVGQTIQGINNLDFVVQGIFESAPRTSSLQYDALLSWTTTVPGMGQMAQNWMNNWTAQGIFTFVQLAPSTATVDVERKLEDMMQLHFEERAENYFLKLQPLQEMYLYGSHIMYSRGMKTGNIRFLYMLGFSALLIFVIACVNYINITLSRSSQSHKEVGVRQVMGSSRSQLMARFISETFITTTLAAAISSSLVFFLIPFANALLGKDLPQLLLISPVSLTGISLFIIGISFIAGAYPAASISNQPISAILKSAAGTVKGTDWFRRSLLIIQYAISIFLIICTITVVTQTRFLINKPLGFNQEQVMVIDINNEVGEKADVLKNTLLADPNVLSVSVGRSAIGGGSYTTKVTPENHEGEISARMFGIDFDFLATYEIETWTGRSFRIDSRADSTQSMMVNRAFSEFMQWEDPIGKKITFESGNSYPIIGVTENFHISSLATSDVEPMILFLNPSPQYASVRIGTGDFQQTVDQIIETYESLAVRTPIDFYFVDQWFQDQYEKEQQVLSMSTLYAVISILLCALGLYGLTGLILQQRKKEISIRKVLGSPIGKIVSMLNQEFVFLLATAFVIATPLAYLLVKDWLGQFVYRVDIGAEPFLIAGAATFLISLSIVSLLTLKTANANLSQNLSNE